MTTGDSPAGRDPGRGPNQHLVGRAGSRRQLETPCLLLDLDALESNIESMSRHAHEHGYRLRPTIKVHKSIEIARRQIDAGACGVSCATLAEAEAMAAAGIRGVLLFSTVVTPRKIERLVALAGKDSEFLVAVDGPENVRAIAAAARSAGVEVALIIDVEVGGRRTGVADIDEVIALVRLTADSPGVRYAGLQAYVGDHQTIPEFSRRREANERHLEPLDLTVDRLHAENLNPQIVSGGGTGTHAIDGAGGRFTEIQAGTYVLMDVNYSNTEMRPHEPFPFRQSLTVMTTVIGTGQRGFAVTDAGVKEIEGEHGRLEPSIVSGAPAGSRYFIIGDDLGRVELPPGQADALVVGDTIEIAPPHCYQTAALYSVYHCVQGDTLVDIWPVVATDNW